MGATYREHQVAAQTPVMGTTAIPFFARRASINSWDFYTEIHGIYYTVLVAFALAGDLIASIQRTVVVRLVLLGNGYYSIYRFGGARHSRHC